MALTIAIATFFPLLVASGIVFAALCQAVFGYSLGIPGLSQQVSDSVWIAASVVAAYSGARLIHLLVAWRRVDDHNRYCWKCRYDLTGNASGICPECGSPVEEEVGVRRCWKCGYNLTGNVSGSCPECGAPGQFEPAENALCRMPVTLLVRIGWALVVYIAAMALIVVVYGGPILGWFYPRHLTWLHQLPWPVLEIGLLVLGLGFRRAAQTRTQAVLGGTLAISAAFALLGLGGGIAAAVTGVSLARFGVALSIFAAAVMLMSDLQLISYHLILAALMTRAARPWLRRAFYVPAAGVAAWFGILLFAIATHKPGASIGAASWEFKLLFVLPIIAFSISVLASFPAAWVVFQAAAQRKRFEITGEWS
ncbi:MAG TPA: zinc ribbon domain-containing protein [Phycisphaerae bacterium]